MPSTSATGEGIAQCTRLRSATLLGFVSLRWVQTVPVTDLPSGVVTFLLTDVVGSTELWERSPQAMDQALARHDEIVVDTVAAEGGTSAEGCGARATRRSACSHGPQMRSSAAHRLQSAIGAETWPAETPLTVPRHAALGRGR